MTDVSVNWSFAGLAIAGQAIAGAPIPVRVTLDMHISSTAATTQPAISGSATPATFYSAIGGTAR